MRRRQLTRPSVASSTRLLDRLNKAGLALDKDTRDVVQGIQKRNERPPDLWNNKDQRVLKKITAVSWYQRGNWTTEGAVTSRTFTWADIWKLPDQSHIWHPSPSLEPPPVVQTYKLCKLALTQEHHRCWHGGGLLKLAEIPEPCRPEPWSQTKQAQQHRQSRSSLSEMSRSLLH